LGGGTDAGGGSDGGGESPNCTVLTSPQGAPIVDAAGNKWTLVSTTTANGVEIYENGQYSSPTALVTELIYINHAVWQEADGGGWWSWVNGAWQSGSNPTGACGVADASATDSSDASQGDGSTAQGFFDDFNGPAGAAPNPAYWTAITGAGGTNCNGGIATCTAANAVLDGNGNLDLTLSYSGGVYYSGWLWGFPADYVSTPKLAWSYGKIEARIKFPVEHNSFHPAFFVVGSDMFQGSPWPACGEVDIVEVFGSLPNPQGYYLSLNGPGGNQYHTEDQVYVPPSTVGTTDFALGYHTYWMTWAPNTMSAGIDNVTLVTWTPSTVNGPWPLNRRMTPIFSFPADSVAPDVTYLPAHTLVDWIRWTPM
jgi:hypothetical protein